MPVTFCNHRWLENEPVAKRTVEIWPSPVKYVAETETKKRAQQPTCNSYAVLKEFTKDKLILAKLEFFRLVANILQPFLAFYQTDKPVLPFMAEDLVTLLKSLLRRFIKPDMLAQCDTLDKLSKIDVTKKEDFVTYKKVDIGIAM